ncbi:MAG: fibrobacter succinogenes major paralogous domain-containing protein [Bacteroidetes bacterium]|nr:fibrobacter succinogenes major paralogous domain-containing protein [Bacteroidota bacterium]
MNHQKTYISSASLIIITLIISSWINNERPVPALQKNDEITIGKQVWMARNLNVATFRNGDTIHQASTKAEWQRAISKKQPAWCYYNNDSTNGAVHGKLYNWYAVTDKRGLAPAGWRIPSGIDWHTLYVFLGGIEGMVGKKLKSTTGWEEQGNGANTVGFNALPSGVRERALINANNGYRWMGSLSIWWSTNKPYKGIDEIECFAIRNTDRGEFEWWGSGDGHSVRCIKE